MKLFETILLKDPIVWAKLLAEFTKKISEEAKRQLNIIRSFSANVKPMIPLLVNN
jgi:hypothetical protein